MATNSTEVAPGMAEAIESRRVELGLSPGELARAAGVTDQGLMPLRRGYRRSYRDGLKFGLCRALGWTNDSIDLLLAGKPPVIARSGDDDPPGAGALLAPDLELAARIGRLAPDARAEVEAMLDELLPE